MRFLGHVDMTAERRSNHRSREKIPGRLAGEMPIPQIEQTSWTASR
jgi:hypothetical protein